MRSGLTLGLMSVMAVSSAMAISALGQQTQAAAPPGQSLSAPSVAAAAVTAPMETSKVIRLRLDLHVKLSKLVPGSALDGRLARPVFWRDRQVFPVDSRVRLVIGQVQQRKKAAAPDDRPFVVRVFAPRHERFVTFSSLSVFLADGSEFPLRASFIGLARMTNVRAKLGRGGQSRESEKTVPRAPRAASDSSPTLVLRVAPAGAPFAALAAALAPEPSAWAAESSGAATLAAGTRARVMLLQSLSASRNQPGDSFQARLLEPVRCGSRVVLPEGSTFQGLVTKRLPPRRLSRLGVLYLTFTRLILPTGAETSIVASPSGAEVDKGSRMNIDAEGGLHGGSPGKGALLLDMGVTAGLAKITDDSTQLAIELLVSTATDASTAGVAKIVAAGASGLFLLTRHGGDVILSPYTEMEVTFNRPLSLPGNAPAVPADSGAERAPDAERR